MTTELVTFKMDSQLLSVVDKTVKDAGFHNRTEFIRNALREKVDEIRLKKAMSEIAHLKGASKKKTSEKEYEDIRKKEIEEYERLKNL